MYEYFEIDQKFKNNFHIGWFEHLPERNLFIEACFKNDIFRIKGIDCYFSFNHDIVLSEIINKYKIQKYKSKEEFEKAYNNYQPKLITIF